MNKRRRKTLNQVLDGLDQLRYSDCKEEASGILKEALTDTQECLDEEEDALDSRPENLRWSAANDDMTENISDLSDALCELEGMIDVVEESKTYRYELIQNDVINTVNLIKQVIHR